MTLQRSHLSLLLLVGLLSGPLVAQSTTPPSPRSVLGYQPGSDGRLASYAEIRDYMQRLAAASPQVLERTIGHTTLERPFDIAIISSKENIQQIEALRLQNARLADPRSLRPGEAQAIMDRGKVFVVINESIHSLEVGPAQAGLLTAFFLATTSDPVWKRVLERVVVILTLCHNPDGYARVVAWWRKTKQDPATRGAPLPFLYNKYVGHDNNRDWFMLTQQETRLSVKELYLRWHPQIVVDQHQMGGRGARMFVPPYVPPFEPHVHPLLRQEVEDLGHFVLRRLTMEGYRGVWCRHQYDAWTPARAFMHYHGAVRFLTEVASARLADPLVIKQPLQGASSKQSPDNPAPWRKGRWGLPEIMDYCQRGALEVLRHAAKHRQDWLQNFYRVHKDNTDATTGPWAFALPKQQPRQEALHRLEELLVLGGLEIRPALLRLPGNAAPEPCDLIKSGQPFFSYAQALLQNTPYPLVRARPGGPILRPYDATSNNLALLMNLMVVPLLKPIPVAWKGPLLKAEELAPLGPHQAPSQSFGLSVTLESSFADALSALGRGIVVQRLTRASKSLPKGSFLFPQGASGMQIHSPAVMFKGPLPARTLKPARMGLLVTHLASMDEGWTRFFFDELHIPFVRLGREAFERGRLSHRVEVVVVADYGPNATQRILNGRQDRRLPPAYLGGIGKRGARALVRFVHEGGRVVALGGSTRFLASLFHVPLVEVGAGPQGSSPRKSRAPFYVPGAMLAARVNESSFLFPGAGQSLPIFFFRARAFQISADSASPTLRFPVRYAPEHLVLAGYAEGASSLAGQGAVAVARVGQGVLVLFGFSPQFRFQTWGSFPLFLNALVDRPHPR